MNRILAITSLAAVSLAIACGDQGTTPPVAAKASPDTADQTLFGVRLVLSDHGVQRALMVADTAFAYDDNTRTELRTVRSTFYTETGVKDATLTSREGTYNSRSGNMEAMNCEGHRHRGHEVGDFFVSDVNGFAAGFDANDAAFDVEGLF